MAEQTQIGGDGQLLAGEDKTLRLEVLAEDTTTPVDMSGWASELQIMRPAPYNDVVLTKASSVTGVFNASRNLNTQRLIAALTRAETLALSAPPYRYEWRRSDPGLSTALAFGPFVVEK